MRIADFRGGRGRTATESEARFSRAFLIVSVLALVTLVGSPWRVRALTNRFVSTSGNDLGGINDCTNSSQPCKTIQNAVNHSGSGDLIQLGPGTYFENVTVSFQNVTIQGDATSGSTVNGNNSDQVFRFVDSVSTLN